MIRLTTSRLLLRDHVPDDLTTHHELFSDPKVMRYLPELMTKSLVESRENLALAIDQIDLPDRKFYFLRIEERETHAHVGEIGYTVNAFTPLGKLVGVGYFIRAAHWGRGYTAEALKELIRFAFEEDGVYRISCGCLKENAPSERVMQKCGLIKEAEFKEYQWHEGKLKDRVEYRLLRAEWRDNQNR
jgi:ribosomal-protein-alanine N-acetyltransferase